MTQPRCRTCMDRRAFIGNATGLAALALAACGDGTVSGVSGTPVVIPGGPVTVRVGDFPALATAGTLVQVTSTFAAKRTGESTFDAFSMVCTHQGCLTSITNGQRFDCPCHASRFDGNGAVLNGPATRPLTKLVTSYDPVTDELTIN